LRTEVYKLFGVDVTQIPGLEFLALQLFSLGEHPKPATREHLKTGHL
jgi:hypothetical protein